MADASTLLTEVEAAISAALTAQAYTVHGRSKQMANLRELREFRQQLKDEIAASSGGGSMCSLGSMMDPQ